MKSKQSNKSPASRGIFSSVGAHFGLLEDDKLSVAGLLKMTYQTVSILLITTLALSLAPASAMAADIGSRFVIAIAATLGITLGTKLCVTISDIIIKQVRARLNSPILAGLASFALTLALAAACMAFPGAFFWAMAMLMPAFITFSGWTTAFLAGMAVLSADTILGNLTGISLVFGKRPSILG